MNIRLIALLLICIFPFPLFAQEPLGTDPVEPEQIERPPPEQRPREIDSPAEEQTEDTPTSPNNSTDDSPDSLDNERTVIPTVNLSKQAILVRDIRLSTFFELVVWLRSLELGTEGSRSELERRLFEYYQIEDSLINVTESEENDSDILVVVDSAREFEFFQTDASNEEYIRLDGGVVIRIENKTQEVEHIINADSLVINLELNILTALGDIEYTLKRADGSEERFDGDSITFNFKSWEGMFLGGEVYTENQLDATSDDDFVFKGKTITRTEDDVVIFDGIELSGAHEFPYYSLRGSKFWLLADNEWALVNAALYVGNVPVFYIPFFFKNADRLFFRPALGLHTQKGPYVNTTTYFFGKPVEKEESFSVLQVTSMGDNDAEREIDGFFLRPRKTSLTLEEQQRKNWMLKLMLDGYSNMGLYTGIAGKFDNLKSISNLEFRFGLGATRAIFEQEGNFTNYVVHNGSVRDHWQSSYLLSFPIPYLRYELSAKVQGNIADGGRWALQFDWYSDRNFISDFHTRDEQFSWGFLFDSILGDEKATENQSTKSSFLWKFSSSYRPNIQAISPWININISRLDVSVDWKSKAVDAGSIPDILVGRNIYSDPERYFFYPAYFKSPDLAVTVSGTLVDYQASASVKRQERELPEDPPSTSTTQGELEPPWNEEGDLPENNDVTSSEFQLASLQPNINKGISFPSPFSLYIRYKLDSSLVINNVTQNQNWKLPEDIDINDFLGYSMLEQENSGLLDYSLGFLNKHFVINGKLDFSVDYYELLSIKKELYSDNEYRSVLNNQYKNRTQTVKHTLTSIIYPLNSFPVFTGTNLTYTLENIIYSHKLDKLEGEDPIYKDSLALWDDEMITGHSFSGLLSTKMEPFSQQISLKVSIPPKDMTLVPTWQLGLGPFSASMSTTIRDLFEEDKLYDPLVTTASLAFAPWVNISQRFTADINKSELITSSTILNLYFLERQLVFTTKLDAKESYDKYFSDPDLSWKDDEESDDIIRLDAISFRAALNYQIPRFWKNRVSVRLKSTLDLKYKFLDFTESAFTLSYGLDFNIYRFIVIAINVNVKNDYLYRYFPGLAEQVNVPHRDFFEDLGYGFNIFSNEALYKSLFKLQSVTISIAHDLRDWTLNVSYTGKYISQGAANEVSWQNVLNVSVQWKPITELRTEWELEDDELTLKE